MGIFLSNIISETMHWHKHYFMPMHWHKLASYKAKNKFIFIIKPKANLIEFVHTCMKNIELTYYNHTLLICACYKAYKLKLLISNYMPNVWVEDIYNRTSQIFGATTKSPQKALQYKKISINNHVNLLY